MKRLSIPLITLFVVLCSFAIAIAFTGNYTPGTGINGTPHDLRQGQPGGNYPAQPPDYLNRICVWCHAPHHAYRPNGSGQGTGPEAPADYTYLPLWNHGVTTQIFTPYTPGSDQPLSGSKHPQSVDYFDKVGSVSLLCLSCHDGTVAVNEYGHAPQDSKSRSSGGNAIADQYKIGADGYLVNHHPIGFDYDSVAAEDTEIYDSSTAQFGTTPVSNYLWNGKMECSTCHAVHNTGNSGEKFLYVSDQNSNLCLSCHAKGNKTP